MSITYYLKALLIFTVVAVGVAALGRTCNVLNPGGVKVNIGGKWVAVDDVERIPDFPAAVYGIGNGPDGYAYIQASANILSDEPLWRIYRKLPQGDWELFAEYPDDLNLGAEFSRQAGTSNLFARRCFGHYVGPSSDADNFRTGPARLYRLTGDGEFVDLSESYWGGLSQTALDELGITECDSSWVVHPDGSLLLVTESTLWKVRDGSAEIVLDDIPAIMTVDELPPECSVNRPRIKVSETGDMLLYNPRIACPIPYSAPVTQPIAVLMSGAEVEPVLFVEWGDYEVVDAAMGPDGAAYIALKELFPSENRCRSLYHGIKVTDEGRSEFLRGINCEFGVVDAFSIDAAGRMYLVYGGQTSIIGDDTRWLLGFPTDKVFAELK